MRACTNTYVYEARTGAHNACAREIAKRVRYPDRCTCQHAHIVAAKFDVRTHSRTVPFWSRRAVSSESRFCAQSLVPLRCLTDLIAPSLHSSLSPSLPLSPSPSSSLSLAHPLFRANNLAHARAHARSLSLACSRVCTISLSLARACAFSGSPARACAHSLQMATWEHGGHERTQGVFEIVRLRCSGVYMFECMQMRQRASVCVDRYTVCMYREI